MRVRCSMGSLTFAALLPFAWTSLPDAVNAQDLEPRAYSPSPVGATFVITGYAHSSGAVAFDAAAPISNAHADLNLATAGVSHVFGLAGHQASVTAALPYLWGDASGDVGEARQSITRSGLGDLRLRVSTLLIGGPALSRQAFAVRKPAPILGVSLLAVAPTGEYMPDKLINLGANRWAFKPEIGVSFPRGPWQADAYAAVWLYADNDDFLNGKRRERDPMGAFQVHLSYTFRPGLWAALNSTFYQGGTTTVDGVRGADRQENARVGLTLSVPVSRTQSLLFVGSKGALTRFGGDFTTFGVSWRALSFH
ncbi:transporter [Caulobacter soli]|uniref:transporter n=1 Tax=Caulobacter soli TaxID=2708539 RepID=UPI0013EA5C6A|nr:transporter [Caulobacter soli]